MYIDTIMKRTACHQTVVSGNCKINLTATLKKYIYLFICHQLTVVILYRIISIIMVYAVLFIIKIVSYWDII